MSPIVVALFVTYLFEANHLASSICTFVAAINFIHKLPEPGRGLVVQKAIKGARKSKPKLDVRLPITQCILHKLVDALDHCSASGTQKVMYKSMFLLAFAAFLRIGEMSVSNGNTSNVLKKGVIAADKVSPFIEDSSALSCGNLHRVIVHLFPVQSVIGVPPPIT